MKTRNKTIRSKQQPGGNNCLTKYFLVYGRTSCNSGGFTLIELLVVLVIVAVLAAVAVSQYQKAVEKSRAVEAFLLLKQVYAANQVYYQQNGSSILSFDQLDIGIPWTGNVRGFSHGGIKDTVSNEYWSLQIHNGAGGHGRMVWVSIIKGKYAGAGFFTDIDPKYPFKVFCGEARWLFNNNVTPDKQTKFSGQSGDYCQKVLKGTKVVPPPAGGTLDFYDLYTIPWD